MGAQTGRTELYLILCVDLPRVKFNYEFDATSEHTLKRITLHIYARCAVLYIYNRIVIIKFAVIFEGKPLQFCFPQRDVSYHCVAHHTSAVIPRIIIIYLYVITYF